MLEVMDGFSACPVCGHVPKGPCGCPGCNGRTVPQAGHWLCFDCWRLVPIRVDAEGGRFVWHSCPKFKGRVGDKKELEATCGAKVTIFPSDEDIPNFDPPENLMRKKLRDLKNDDPKKD